MGPVTTSALQAKIEEVEAAPDMEEEAKNKLVRLYRKALNNLQTAKSNAEAAEAFQRAAETAPARIEAIREAMEAAAAASPSDRLEIDESTPLRQIEQRLQKEKADLAAVDARRKDFETRLEEEAERPARIRQRLVEASKQHEELSDQLSLPPLADAGPATAEARRLALQTRLKALSAEIKMLDQELLSQPMRVDLLEAERDKAAASVKWVGERVKVLDELVNRRRQQEAEQARAEAEATRREAQGKPPSVVNLAERNADLSEELAQMASRLDGLAGQAKRADKLAGQIEKDFASAQDTIEIGGLSQELGFMLRQQRQSLPDVGEYRRAAREREETAAEIGVRRLRHRAEAERLADLDGYLAGLVEETAATETPEVHEELGALARSRAALLEQAIEADDVYLQRLGELESAHSRLLDAIEAYDTFLDEQLPWVRSASLLELHQLTASTERLWQYFSPALWDEVGRALAYQATYSPVFALLALGLALLLWIRSRLIRFIRGLSTRLGKPTTDQFGYSLLALALTLVATAPWPLVMAVTGWQLMISVEASEFTTALGGGLLVLAGQFYHLRAFRLICMRDGLAAAHFRWPDSSLRLLRTELNRLTWAFLPTALIARVAANFDPLHMGGVLGRLSLLIALGALSFSLYRLLHPVGGVLAGYLRGRRRRTFKQLYRLGFRIIVAYPLVLGLLSVMGYLYTAGVLMHLVLQTAWFTGRLTLIASLARRWLLVSRRRLAYEAAMERRDATAAERLAEAGPRGGEEIGEAEVEEPQVDLAGLSDRSSKLLHTGILLYAVIGFWVIWSDVFPALRVLDQFTLWHQVVTVDGEEQIRPVTLASIGLALIYGAAAVLLAKQLPAVLEMILLQYTEMTAGSRYTITTLTTYTIFTVGVMLVAGTIGADWSKLQWLVAALGVGIGFGLQEIVANFISGIIILFERPIRIGDVVTVGDTDGVVSRIRSRATTIRNWDGKELLVPNKEFITGRLLNWSLSDQSTRIIISVGVAYGSNVRQAMRLLEEAALENDKVLDDPPPSVIFESFGDNSLGLLMRCFVDSVDVRYPTLSELNEAINDKFNAAGVVIAYPQRDLHLDTTRPLQVQVWGMGPGGRSGADG
jgi:potassium efflux system protein